MSRPKKPGLEYFPKDVDFYEDFKIIDLLTQYGAVGVTVFDFVLSRIYREGYYLELPIERLALLAVRAIGSRWVTKELAINVITYCGDIGLFRVDLLKKGVYTSAGIQRRYEAITARRKFHRGNYWILDENGKEYPESLLSDASNKVNVTETGVNVTETPVNVAEMTTKEKKTKEKKSKEKGAAVIATLNDCGFQINSHIVDVISSLEDDYGEVWVCEAIRRASDNGVRTIRYVEGILRRWDEKGKMDDKHQPGNKPDRDKEPVLFADEYI